MKLKIVLVGAGSREFGPASIRDILLSDALNDQDLEITLMDINPDDYVSFTSYTHHPYYEDFILEIPDNYSNGAYYNVPMEDLISITNHAIKQGYSVAWDGDVSEKGFSARQGIAVLPKDENRKDLFEKQRIQTANFSHSQSL